MTTSFQTLPKSVICFYDKEREFEDWLNENVDVGYFLNTVRNPQPTTKIMLHRAECQHMGRSASHRYTKPHMKLCSLNRRELTEVAVGATGTEPTLCHSRKCFG